MAAGQVITKPKYMPLPRLINTIITHSGTTHKKKKKDRKPWNQNY